MKSNWLRFVPLLKVIKCEFLFFNQEFFNMKSHIAKSRIASPDLFLTPSPFFFFFFLISKKELYSKSYFVQKGIRLTKEYKKRETKLQRGN